MTDITELTGALKHANQHRISRLIVEAPNYELRQLAVEVEQYTDQLIEALEKAQQRIAELEGILEVSRGDLSDTEDAMHLWAERAKELESRTVTVKLPELCVGVVQGGHAVMVPYAAGHWFNKTAILEMLTAAGIKWEDE